MDFWKPKKTIFRNDNTPYLIRRTVFECKLFAIKIHNIIASDDECMHDHPWAFLTFLVKGGYVEYRKIGEECGELSNPMDYKKLHWTYKTKSKVYGRFSLLYRPSHYTHRLEIHQPVTSLVLTFKKKRQWGFFTPKGWTEWFRFKGGECD